MITTLLITIFFLAMTFLLGIGCADFEDRVDNIIDLSFYLLLGGLFIFSFVFFMCGFVELGIFLVNK